MVRVLLVIVGAAVVLVAGAYVFLTLSAVNVLVRNERCDPIALKSNLPSTVGQIVGVVGNVPDVIPTNGQATVRWPRQVSVDVDLRPASVGSAVIAGNRIDFSVSSRVTDVKVNGASILRRAINWNPADRAAHDVTITCA